MTLPPAYRPEGDLKIKKSYSGSRYTGQAGGRVDWAFKGLLRTQVLAPLSCRVNWLIILSVILFLGCSGTRPTQVDIEQKRRIKMEMTSIIDLVRERRMPPIEFKFNSAELLSTSFNMLDKIADVLLRYPKFKLVVEGHTDYIGDDKSNKELSYMRANSVKAYLVKKGIHPTDIKTYGFGEERPVVNDKTDAARALNRRVEFRIATRNWESVY